MKLALIMYFAMLGTLLVLAFKDSIWGWRGLFFYHVEDEEGHMYAYLGKRYYVRVLGWHHSWIRRA